MIVLDEKNWEDYQKEIQKISARALGIAMTQDKVTKRKKAKQAAEVEASTAKKAVSSATTGLEKAIKGRFGKQVTEAFGKKSRMLVSF
ncbi:MULTISPECIES: hypothetical protein [unclassified Enterococcus]|uniref:hypothetical protein n=1 Tax=unclassified Enterococcus TaxID=2608891 RepID=UPI0013EE2DFD|nr:MULTISPECIES: hypothetical protein [unclassified Enterococcus]